MSQVYTLFGKEEAAVNDEESINSARQQLELIVRYVYSKQALAAEHGEVEKTINENGNELLRLLLQGYLERRQRNEARHEEVTGDDGVVRGYCREGRSRQLETLFGTVSVGRKVYSEAGTDSLMPMDGALNLGADKYSDGLKKQVVDEVIHPSFDGAVEAINKRPGGRVPKRQLEAISVSASQDFQGYYAARCLCPVAEETDDLLVLSFDGKGIVMRQEDLRTHTKKAAQKAGKKRKTRLSTGEKRNRKRMATVATVYRIEPHERSAQAIMGDETTDERPRPRNKRVWASVEREMSAVIEEAFQEALQRDPEKKRQWVVLVDGDKQQARLIKAAIKRHNVNTVQVIDFIHVLEYLWKAAYSFHRPGSDEAEEWVSKRALALLQKGKASDVAAGIRRSATLQGLSIKARKAVDKCAEYLINNRKMIRYDLCLEQGLPIATGVIEGACRHLIND